MVVVKKSVGENPKEKFGVVKPCMSDFPPLILLEICTAMREGCIKYGKYNYRRTDIKASVYYDAALRHLFAWFEGQDIDPDSGISHVTKAITSLMVLRDAQIYGTSVDDRPPHSNMDIMDKFKDTLEKIGV